MFMFSFSSNSLAKYDKLAYDFSFNDLDGTPLKLSSFKDRIIVVVNVSIYVNLLSFFHKVASNEKNENIS